MKKSELLTLSVAVAGSVAAIMPQVAAATACGTASVTAPTSCDIAAENYLAEAIAVSGSRGVSIDYINAATYFAACAYHLQGKSSFGMSTDSSDMTVRTATGRTAASGTGCN